MIVEETKKRTLDIDEEANINNKEIKTEKEKSKKKKKVNLIRLKDRDLKNVQTGIPAFNRYFKENHMKVNNLKNNRDKISKSQPSH